MEFRLNKGEEKTLDVPSPELYSPQKLLIRKDEVYRFSCDEKQRWKDWWIKTTPKGFYNIFAVIAGIRLKGVKCFCLCAAYNENDEGAFPIGLGTDRQMAQSGRLSFFPNDSAEHYGNNTGCVKVHIKRLE